MFVRLFVRSAAFVLQESLVFVCRLVFIFNAICFKMILSMGLRLFMSSVSSLAEVVFLSDTVGLNCRQVLLFFDVFSTILLTS